MKTCGNESLDDRRTFSGFRSQCTIERGFVCKYCSAFSICKHNPHVTLRLGLRNIYVYNDDSFTGFFQKNPIGSTAFHFINHCNSRLSSVEYPIRFFMQTPLNMEIKIICSFSIKTADHALRIMQYELIILSIISHSCM